MKFIKRDKTKGSLTNDTRGASGIVSNNSSGNSSTTLESHRIWGQLFDGTNDVTGDMQNVGSITATGNIQTDESVIIKQLDADGNEVEGGDLTISVEDKKAKFSGKDQYVFDNQIKSDSAEIDSKLNVNGTTNLKDLNVSSDAEFKSSITVEGDSNLTNVTSTNITNSDTIKTKNLEVTGSAHFFELIIDKIKSAGGAVLFTPANGFKVDIVESVIDGYKLYWQADDGSGNQADNMWKVNDQALCMSFNQAKVGTSHNVSNKYYWCLVTEVSDNSNPIQKDGEYYHYIVISSSVCDGTVNPEIGDTIAMLGYRGTDDKKRQSAIYISAYTSLDKGLTAPLLAQYQGINDFNLESHRKSYFDAVGAKFIGNFEVNDGQSVEDYINDKINGAESGTPYIGENGNWYIWDSDTKAYKDSGIKAEGQDGTNGKDGTDGKNAVQYVIEVSPSSVVQLTADGVPADSANYWQGTSTNGYVAATLYKIEGSSKTMLKANWKVSDTIAVGASPVRATSVPFVFHSGTTLKSFTIQAYEDTMGPTGPEYKNLLASVTIQLVRNGKDGVDGKDAVTYILESTPSTIILNSDGSFSRNNQYDEQKYLYVQGYKIVNGKRTNNFTVNGNPITCRLSFNDGDVYTEYTDVYDIGIDFDPQYEDSYYSLLEEIGQNGLKNARAIMFEGTEYAEDKVLASIDIPIIQNGKNGTNGKDAILYKMYPSNEYAVVDSDGYLYTNAQYLIYRQIGSSKTAITPLSTGYHVQYNITGSWTNATINGSYCVVNSKVKYSSTSNANYIPIRLVSGSGTLETVVDQKVIPVTYKASATLTINQELGEIKTNVQDTQNLVDSLDEDIQTVQNNTSTLEQKANSIESKVTSNTTTINNLSGSVTSLQSDMSDVKQTASSITSTVSSMKDGIIGANCMLGLNGQGWSSNTIYDDAGNSFHCESTDWFQSHPICDFSGDYTFSFNFWSTNGGNLQIKILDFTQMYYDDGIYNQYVDFGTYTPCKILTTSSRVSNVTLTNYATSGTLSTWTYTNAETITLAVGDNVAVRVTNSTNSRYNSIYGTVSAINTSSKSVTVKAIALLDQPNTICTLSCPMDKKDGTDINYLHYDDKLGRYWIRFKESRGSAKTFVILFRNLSTSSVEYISRLMIEESVEYPHKYNSTGQASQSMIKQTANEILMNVNDTYVKIGDGNITLNGDTKVNGSLTLNDEKQGFLLMGNGGTTEISPKSIGTYNEFASKTTNVIKTHYDSTIYGVQSVDGNFYGFTWNVSQKLGTFKKGSYIKILNYTNSVYAIGGTAHIGTPFATFHIYENGTLTKTINVGNKTSADIANYTVVGDNVEVIVAGKFTIDVSASIWDANQDILSPRDTYKPTLHPRQSIYVTVNWNNEVPTSSAFMLIGYDGFAANFGTNTTVYCGKDGFIANYGDSLFKITTDGIVERRNKASIEVINGSTSSSYPYEYNLKDGIDTILCKTGNTIIKLPSNPYQGQKVKIHDKSQDGETWINFQGYMVRANNHYNTRTRQSKFQCDGQYVRIYTFIGDTWFEEFTG